jgi:ABC-type Mn2+/Zn2+ transport system ATPase subunit
MSIKELRNRLERKKGEEQKILENIQEEETSLKLNKRRSIRYEKALQIAKEVGLQTQKQLEYHLAEQVSLALASVFDDPYELKIKFEEKRGKTEALLLFKRRELEVKPIGFVGGGAIDIASLALRIAYWSMRQDVRTRPVFLLDEPFARLKGEEANRRALKLLQELSHKLGIQIIMISDERIPRNEIIENADKVFLVSQEKGISKIKEV